MRPLTDFHSHILPRVDDGSQSVEESLELLRQSAEQGVQRILATPHFYAHHDSPERFLRRREAAWEQLREAMEDQPQMPKVELGAEVYYFNGMRDVEDLSALTISGKKYLLLEMPLAPWTESMYREIEGIYVKQGITPIIAHVDRYIGLLRTYGIPERLAELPVLVQANASFFLGRSRAMNMLRDHQIHLLGSDCHNLTDRSPNLGPAADRITRKLGQGALDWIHENERAVFPEEAGVF